MSVEPENDNFSPGSFEASAWLQQLDPTPKPAPPPPSIYLPPHILALNQQTMGFLQNLEQSFSSCRHHNEVSIHKKYQICIEQLTTQLKRCKHSLKLERMSRPESQKYISSLLEKMVDMREEIDQLKQEKVLKSKASTARVPKSREGLEKHLNEKHFSKILGIAQSPLTLGQQIIQYLAKQTLKEEDKQPGVAKYLRSKIKAVAEIREASELMSLLEDWEAKTKKITKKQFPENNFFNKSRIDNLTSRPDSFSTQRKDTAQISARFYESLKPKPIPDNNLISLSVRNRLNSINNDASLRQRHTTRQHNLSLRGEDARIKPISTSEAPRSLKNSVQKRFGIK